MKIDFLREENDRQRHRIERLGARINELESELKSWQLYYMTLEKELEVLKTPHECQPGDEGWFWKVTPLGRILPVFIQNDTCKGFGFTYRIEDAIKDGHRFYRAVLPEVTHENSD